MQRIEIPKDLKGKELTGWLVAKRDELMDNLCQDPEQIEKFVNLWNGNLQLHSYSINNIILAFFQYPKMSMLAGYKKWMKLGRQVKKGEKAIKILAPMVRKYKNKEEEDEYRIGGWRYVNVFDINQTEGENLDFGHPELIKGEIPFETVAEVSPLPVTVEYYGTSNGVLTDKEIRVASKDNEASMVATLIHEMGHYYLGHPGNEELDRPTKEVEAETVSYMVTSYLGMENEKSQYYIGGWNGCSDKLKGRGTKIVKAAEQIIKSLEGAVA